MRDRLSSIAGRVASIAAALLVLCSTAVAQQSPAKTDLRQPNFVFFLVDDLGWMDIGANGSAF